MQGDGLIEPYRDHDTTEVLADARHHIDAGDLRQAQAIVDAALVRGGEQKDLLALLAWLRAEGGDRSGAASAFLRLSVFIPLDPEQDAFIGFDHLAEGRAVEAEPHLRKALIGNPENAVFRTAFADVLLRLDRPREAISIAIPLVRNGTASIELWQIVARATSLLDRPRLAEMLGRRAVRRHPLDIAPALAIARELLNGGRAERSLGVLAGLSERRDSELWYLRSVALAQLDRFGEAWSAIERALAIAPAERAYLLHAIAVLGRLGRYGDAAALLDLLDPPGSDAVPGDSDTDEAWLRGVFATYTEAGRYDRAIAVGARIVRLLPDDLDFLSVYETVIAKHLYARLIASKPTPAPTMDRSARPANHGRIKAPSFSRSISALFRREMKTRFGRSRLGYLWVLFEPLAHIGIMILLIGMLNHGGLPPIGQSFAVFYFTGIIPFHMFTHTTSHLIGSVPENRPLLQIPRVRVLDIFAARAVLEAVTELIVSAIFLVAFALIGLSAMPLEPLPVVGALLLLWVAAIGVGMISAAIVSVFPAWERIWGATTSVIYFTSGTFYVPRMMPIWIRDILVWNPVLQGIELVRFHYFHEPAPEWLSVHYLVGFAIGALAIALVLERFMRRRMLDIE